MPIFTETQINHQKTLDEENIFDNSTDFTLREISINDINLIKELWEKLNQLHLNDSRFFKEHYKAFTFENRCTKFKGMNKENFRLEIVENKNLQVIGYCLSTIKEEIGEIDSLFIEDAYRKLGLGNLLINRSIKWLNNNNCLKILVAVADGHEEVFEFYMRTGFYPRLTYLELGK